MYTEQPSGWRNTAEVDFIESQNGPIPGGLNSNFAGTGNQVGIFYPDDPNWHGHIQALFSNDPEDPTKIDTSISNSYNNNVATTTLTYNQGCFFVLDTTPTVSSNCTITISNLTMKGNLGSPHNCPGVIRH